MVLSVGEKGFPEGKSSFCSQNEGEARQAKQLISYYCTDKCFSNYASGNSRGPTEMLTQEEGKKRVMRGGKLSNSCSLELY